MIRLLTVKWVRITLLGAVLGAAGGVILTVWAGWRAITVEQRIDRYSDSIWRHSQATGLPPELVRAVIRAESGGEPRAVSKTGACGLMQLSPAAEQDTLTALHIPKGDLFDPDYNIRVGTSYLRALIIRFDGDVYLALAAYNYGPTWAERRKAENPDLTGQQIVEKFAPPVTRRYCRDILHGKPLRLSIGSSNGT